MTRSAQRFYRGYDTSTISDFGLGFPIAKTRAERMDGEIFMESEAGKGNTLALCFPATT
jgi:signal transduction histidine kinase